MKRINPFHVYGSSIRVFLRNHSVLHNDGSVFPEKIHGDKFGISISSQKLNIWFLIFFCIIMIFMARLIHLQIIEGDTMRALAEENRIRILEIKANRGLVYDRNIKLLVE